MVHGRNFENLDGMKGANMYPQNLYGKDPKYCCDIFAFVSGYPHTKFSTGAVLNLVGP